MNETDYEVELQKQNTTLNFKKQQDFADFQKVLTSNTIWQDVTPSMTIEKAHYGKTPLFTCASTDAQWDANNLAEGLVVNFTGLYKGIQGSAVVNHLTSPLSLLERGGIKCKLASEYEGKDLNAYASLVNQGISYFGKNLRILIRGGQLMAAHTTKYNSLSQEIIFDAAKDYMQLHFPEGKFLDAVYTPDITDATYSICNGNDAFLKEYANDWIDAGLPKGLLDKTYPVLIFSTSDTGRYPLSIKPRLYIGKAQYPLGTDVEVKHTGRALINEMNSYADQAYTKINQGINSVRDMLTHEINHPYATFVKVSSKVGLTKKIKTCMQEALANFKDEFDPSSKVTAFNIFKAICDVQLYGTFQIASPLTQMACKECIYRIYSINWDEVDKAGIEEI